MSIEQINQAIERLEKNTEHDLEYCIDEMDTNSTKTNNYDQHNAQPKVMAYRKQVEYGAKKFIKP